MRLRQIEIFYHVYRTGSISGAARDLNVSQPSVSKVLRHAEDQLGVELFLRRKGKLIPTAAAHELFAEAEDIYARLSVFNRALENIGKRRGGHLRIAVLPALSLSFAPDLIARLRAADPEMTFELTTLHSSDVSRALVEREADLCLGFDFPADDRFTVNVVGEGKVVLVSAKPIEPQGGAINAEMLQGEAFIGMHDSGPLGRAIDAELAARGIAPDEIVTAHTYHMALSLVRKRVGFAITDQFTAYSHLGSGLHRYLLPDWPRFPVTAASLASHPDLPLIEQACGQSKLVAADIESAIASMQPPKA